MTPPLSSFQNCPLEQEYLLELLQVEAKNRERAFGVGGKGTAFSLLS